MDSYWIAGKVGAVVAALSLLRRDTRALVCSWAASIFIFYLIVARYAGSQGRGLQYHIYSAPLVVLCGAVAFERLARGRAGRALAIGLFGVMTLHQAVVSRHVLAERAS